MAAPKQFAFLRKGPVDHQVLSQSESITLSVTLVLSWAESSGQEHTGSSYVMALSTPLGSRVFSFFAVQGSAYRRSPVDKKTSPSAPWPQLGRPHLSGLLGWWLQWVGNASPSTGESAHLGHWVGGWTCWDLGSGCTSPCHVACAEVAKRVKFPALQVVWSEQHLCQVPCLHSWDINRCQAWTCSCAWAGVYLQNVPEERELYRTSFSPVLHFLKTWMEHLWITSFNLTVWAFFCSGKSKWAFVNWLTAGPLEGGVCHCGESGCLAAALWVWFVGKGLAQVAWN